MGSFISSAPGAISKYDKSAEMGVVSASLATFNHTLGVVPKLLRFHLVCKVAEAGYAIGETLEVPPSFINNGASGGLSVRSAANNVRIVFANHTYVYMIVVTTGSNGYISNASWNLVCEVFS